MARTPLFRFLQRAMRKAHHAGRPPSPAPTSTSVSRRQFLGVSVGAAALAPLAMACGDDGAATPTGPRIAIIGGGIAGLHCAYQLQAAGVDATVYEASLRTGGRMFTSRDAMAGDQLIELGGELIDTGHVTMQMLAADFGLALDDLAVADADVQGETFFFDGAVLSDATLVAGFTPLAALMANTVTTAEADDVEFARIDGMSISTWLESEAGLPPTDLMRRVLEVGYLEEYGLEADNQSIFNLLYLIDYDDADPFHIFGNSDERFHVHAGNDAITTALADALGEAIVFDHALTKVGWADDVYALRFDHADGRSTDVSADHVVFALPFTMLRGVDLDDAGLSVDKRTMIDTLGYGTNAKLMLQFTGRPWRAPGGTSGGCITDVGQLQSTWETTRGQAGAQGILTNFVGGDRGLAMGDGSAEDRAAEVLPWLDQVFSGTAATYIAGSAVRQHWPTAPYVKGSYASYLVGQWDFWGTEGQREGNAHFCGEHTSLESQGYMEGGAETGALVAAEILDDLALTPAARHAELLTVLLQQPHPCFQRGGDVRQRMQARRRARRVRP